MIRLLVLLLPLVAAAERQPDVRDLELSLLDPDRSVRLAAIEALEDIGGDRAALALALALGDEEEDLREEAVRALGEVGGETAFGVLQRALDDEKASVRRAAEEVLVELSRAASSPR